MEAIWGLKVHPAAELFPLLDGDDFDKLCQDIKENGQQEPIVLYSDDGESKILDGRNRFNACKKIGIMPTMQARLIDDPIKFVVSANARRRHLTPSQLSAVGADCVALYAAEAKKRQLAGKKPEPSGQVARRSEGADSHRARNQAAAATGSSGRSVARALHVKNKGVPELYQAVKDGKVSVRLAENVVKNLPDPVTQRAVVIAALAESEPEKELQAHAAERPAMRRRKPLDARPPAARIKAAVSALEDLEQRLERLGILSSLHKHVTAIREGIQNV